MEKNRGTIVSETPIFDGMIAEFASRGIHYGHLVRPVMSPVPPKQAPVEDNTINFAKVVPAMPAETEVVQNSGPTPEFHVKPLRTKHQAPAA